jgi:hypothetical protein
MLRAILFLSVSLLISGCQPRYAKFEPVVKDIQAGVVLAPTNGTLQLPLRFAGVTHKGEVFAEWRADGRLMILFPTWCGRGADLEGLLYCSGVLESSDFYTIDWGAAGKVKHIDVRGRDMLIVHDYRPHWYFVRRRLD